MPGDMKMTIQGLEELQKLLSDPTLIDAPIKDFLHKSTLSVEDEAKRNAVVDTGRYRASITSEVEPRKGTVGSNVEYAPFIEFGTKPHWPPPGALEPWARRHGFASEFMVRRAIAQRGTKALHTLENALKVSKGKIQDFLDQVGNDILGRWQRNG